MHRPLARRQVSPMDVGGGHETSWRPLPIPLPKSWGHASFMACEITAAAIEYLALIEDDGLL